MRSFEGSINTGKRKVLLGSLRKVVLSFNKTEKEVKDFIPQVPVDNYFFGFARETGNLRDAIQEIEPVDFSDDNYGRVSKENLELTSTELEKMEDVARAIGRHVCSLKQVNQTFELKYKPELEDIVDEICSVLKFRRGIDKNEVPPFM